MNPFALRQARRPGWHQGGLLDRQATDFIPLAGAPPEQAPRETRPCACASRHPACRPPPAEKPGILGRCRAGPGARHWRQYRSLQPGQCPHAPADGRRRRRHRRYLQSRHYAAGPFSRLLVARLRASSGESGAVRLDHGVHGHHGRRAGRRRDAPFVLGHRVGGVLLDARCAPGGGTRVHIGRRAARERRARHDCGTPVRPEGGARATGRARANPATQRARLHDCRCGAGRLFRNDGARGAGVLVAARRLCEGDRRDAPRRRLQPVERSEELRVDARRAAPCGARPQPGATDHRRSLGELRRNRSGRKQGSRTRCRSPLPRRHQQPASNRLGGHGALGFADGHGVARAPHRVPQPHQHAARSGIGAAEGDRAAAGARQRARARHPSTSDREPAARRSRQRRRAPPRDVGRRPARRLALLRAALSS